MKPFLVLVIAVVLSSNPLWAQQPLTQDDYKRAVGFLWQNVNNKKAFNVTVRPNWFADSTGLWYIVQDRSAKSFMKVTFPKLNVDRLFDHDKLAPILSGVLHQEVKGSDLPISDLEVSDPGHLTLTIKEKRYLLDMKSYTVVEKNSEATNPLESKSPDGKWVAYTENYNLFVKSASTGAVRQLSKDGKKNYEYASFYGWGDIMEGEGGERPKHFRVNWSPDSKYLQAFACDLRNARKMFLLDWGVDTLYRARLLSYYRGSPGDTSIVYMIPVFYDVEKGEQIRTALPKSTHTNPTSFTWSGPGQIIADFTDRGYQKYNVVKVDLMKGTLDPLILEASKTNIDNFAFRLADAKNKIIFNSERSGWRQIYSLDLKTKTVKPVAPGEYYVDAVRRWDEKSGTVYFVASGREAGRNPYLQHVYSVSLDKGEVKLLTPENANHDVEFSPDGRYFFDNMSTSVQSTQTTLRDSKTGKVLLEISKADVSALTAMKWSPPETFVAKGRDGKTDIYGALYKPTNFDPAKKYPIIDQSYTGPHTQMFPRTFARIFNGNQALAELGFIVMTVDGMGTAGRSKAFHDVSYKNMGMNLTDHVLAMKQLAERFSWIDINRVGIFGHSAGGYDAGHAMLQFPDFYKVAVASSADHDFRMEKDWWPEMYMGWPVDSTYHLVSNITMAGNIKGKLLITHGGIDENVNPSATFKMAEALVKANKQFDMLVFPSQHHGYTGLYNEYFTKKKWNYFVEHLLGVKPIWDFKFE